MVIRKMLIKRDILYIQNLNKKLEPLGLILEGIVGYGSGSRWLMPSSRGDLLGTYIIGGTFDEKTHQSKDVLVYTGPLEKILDLIEFSKENNVSLRYQIFEDENKYLICKDGKVSIEELDRGAGLFRQLLRDSEY